MKRSTAWIYVAVSMAGGLLVPVGAQAQIGVMASQGAFDISGVKNTGTATIFEGDRVATGVSSSQVHLSSGIDLTLAPHSEGAIFADHVALTSGTVSGQIGTAYRVVTPTVTLQSAKAGTEAKVQVADNHVTVAIPNGQADIANARGVTVSHMVPGQVLSYQNLNQPSDESTEVQAQGVLERQDGHYLVRDRYTNTVSELSGNVPAQWVNKLVLVHGEMGAGKSSVPQVDRVLTVKNITRTDATSGVPCEHDPGGSPQKEMSIDGQLSRQQGHYLVSTRDHGYVEVVGDVDGAQVGKNVHMKGIAMHGETAYAPAEQVVYTEKRKFVFSDSPCAGLITGGVLVTAGMLFVASEPDGQSVRPISF